MMRNGNLIYPVLAVCLYTFSCAASPAVPLKPRVIVLTDIAPNNVEPDLAHMVINAYEKDLPNLKKRSDQKGFQSDESRQSPGYWPTPDYLRARTVPGSTESGFRMIGEGNDSEGSRLIIDAADEDDERPLWVLAWGGGNTLAQAIWRVQLERSEGELKEFLSKIRFYTITDQDMTYKERKQLEISSHQWLRREFEKDLFFIWDECAWKYQNGTGKKNWDAYAVHIQGHGNLGGCFERGLSRDGKTYAFTNQDNPAKDRCYQLAGHFYPASFNNFAARMDWAKEGAGNRNPIVTVNGSDGMDQLWLTPRAGAAVSLDASRSHDPEGDDLSFRWWVPGGPGGYAGEIEITGSAADRAVVKIPVDAAGQPFHVICEVTDNGTPNLTGYRRIIFEPKSRFESGVRWMCRSTIGSQSRHCTGVLYHTL